MSGAGERVEDVGERGLLQILQAFCPSSIVGDDAALLEMAGQPSLAVTTDVLVDGVHFSEETAAPEDVGWRAAAANLSDLAAMGASPLGITVGLSLPGTLSVSWVERLYRGLDSCLGLYHSPILGGDVCRSPTLTVAITALGQVPPERALRRSAARPGDAILATGPHGASRAGLALLLNPDRGKALEKREREALILAHQRPRPRLDVIPHLWALAGSPPIAAMDSSDGLADAVIQICQCSGVGAEVDRHRIPLPPGLSGWVSPEEALDWALYGGEDFELILCLPEGPARSLLGALGGGAAAIGKITAGRAVTLVDSRGVYPQQALTLARGFQHF